MRFKLGLVVGFAAGYVLGSRAGRERYEQIRRWWGQLMGSPTVHRATDRAKEMAGERSKRVLYAVQSGVGKAGSAVKDRLSREEHPTERTEDILAAPMSSGTAPEDTSSTMGQAFDR